jgi:hypothetical protein
VFKAVLTAANIRYPPCGSWNPSEDKRIRRLETLGLHGIISCSDLTSIRVHPVIETELTKFCFKHFVECWTTLSIPWQESSKREAA